MKLFYRYVAKEIGITFLIGCAFFLFLLTMEDCFSFLKLGISLKTIKIFILLLTTTIGFAIPMAFLFSLIMGFSRLSSSNAIIIMQSAGISMKGMIAITIIFSLLLSFLARFINGDLAPKQMFYLSTLSAQNHSFLKEKTFTKIKEREIYVDKIKDKELISIYITENERIIFAKRGILEGPLLLLKNGQVHEPDRELPMYHIMKFSTLAIPITEEENIQRTSIEHLTLSELKKRRQNPYIETEFHKRLSISYAPFFLCLIGIPLGLRQRKRERAFGIGASTAIILLYYLMFLGLEGFSKEGIIPSFSLWLVNIIFGLGGILMLKKCKYS